MEILQRVRAWKRKIHFANYSHSFYVCFYLVQLLWKEYPVSEGTSMKIFFVFTRWKERLFFHTLFELPRKNLILSAFICKRSNVDNNVNTMKLKESPLYTWYFLNYELMALIDL